MQETVDGDNGSSQGSQQGPEQGAETGRFTGFWQILQSDARFLPVAGHLHIDRFHRASIRWADAPFPALELFAPTHVEMSAECLHARTEKEGPSGNRVRCRFTLVQTPRSAGETQRLFGIVQVEDDRADKSTGTFVAEEIDPDVFPTD